MDEPTFWKMIEAARDEADGDCEAQVEALVRRLSEMPEEEIFDFDGLCLEMRHRAYRWDLWGASYLLNGGSSDDGFEYFRGWLIAQGRAVYEQALRDPDSLADVVTEAQAEEADFECEDMLYTAMLAYEKKTGTEMPEREGTAPYPDITGERWEEDDLETLLPKLWKRTATDDEGEP